MQSPWLVAALTIATFGIYGIYWLGLTWWQFHQQEDGDRHMHPFWHAVASLVPIYGYFRFHAHMRLLAEFGRGAPWTLAPGPVTLAWIVLNVVGFAAARPEVPNWLPLVVTLADGQPDRSSAAGGWRVCHSRRGPPRRRGSRLGRGAAACLRRGPASTQPVRYAVPQRHARDPVRAQQHSLAWHAGEDWFGTTGTPIYAVGNGTVVYSSMLAPNSAKPLQSGATTTYPGGVVIIQHTLTDGSSIWSMYAHLDPSKILVPQNATVSKGQKIADGLIRQTTASGADNTHLHWEMRFFFDASGIHQAPAYKKTCAGIPGPGYTYPGHPDSFVANGGAGPTYHWTNPSTFVANHQQATTLPAGHAYVADFSSSDVAVIDAATDTVSSRLALPLSAFSLAVDGAGSHLYASEQGGASLGGVGVIDLASQNVTSIPVGDSTFGIVSNTAGTRVYASNSPTGSLYVVDPVAQKLITRVPVGSNTCSICGSYQFELAINGSGSQVYMTHSGDRRLFAVDTASNTVEWSVPVPGTPSAVAVDPAGSRVYVGYALAGDAPTSGVAIFDAGTTQLLARIAVTAVTALVTSPDGTRVYATSRGQNTVYVISTAAAGVIAVVGVPSPVGVATNATGTRVYVVDEDTNQFSVIDTATYAVVGPVATGGNNPVGVVAGP